VWRTALAASEEYCQWETFSALYQRRRLRSRSIQIVDNLITASAVSDEEYCQLETFRPRCLPGETVIISKAIYGRMSDTGRCLQDEIEFVAMKDDPMYMSCFEDVLQLVSMRCGGRPDCEMRIPDPEMEKTNPCYKHLAKYLEVTYHCIKGMRLLFMIQIVVSFFTIRQNIISLLYRMYPNCVWALTK